jgi:putative SOS response-associated peptidase YedK
MCGRYTITIDKSTIEHRFGGRFYIAHADFEPTYNAAPSQFLPIIRTHHPDRIELAKWGFVPEDHRHRHVRPQNNARLSERSAHRAIQAPAISRASAAATWGSTAIVQEVGSGMRGLRPLAAEIKK